VYAYSLSADDGSPIRAQIQHAADKFSDLNAMSDVEAAAAIRRDDIDILLDLTGFKAGGRFGICARRPARSHVSFRGFSASMGSRRVDYAIVDRIVGADDEEWSEARIFVPAPYYLYDFRAEASHEAVTRREYGLPEDGVVLCAFHKAFKITPDAFALWMDILSKVPNAVLWFRDLPDKAVGRLREQAHGHGVNAARLIFAPYESRTQARYFARHRLGDLMLDALHHNAVESACDALGEGLPVVTLRGSAMASRVGACLLTAAGLPDLIASTPQEYVELATTIAQDRNAISRLKKQLLDNRESAPLFDTTSSVQRLESVFKRIVERMKSGHPPTTFDL
jgi:predicted O-linked N-acetylglucosamine transferase (SPINDLY family)